MSKWSSSRMIAVSSFHAHCPALKGLHVGGETEEEAIKNTEEAAIAYIDSFIKHGDRLPDGVILTQTSWKSEILNPKYETNSNNQNSKSWSKIF